MSIAVLTHTITLAFEFYIYVICFVCLVVYGSIIKIIVFVYTVVAPKHTNITTAILISPFPFKPNIGNNSKSLQAY